MNSSISNARAYYNEIDPFAAEWLRYLIAFGHIANGDVDERSIEDVHPSDIRGYTQCHFFAGIGGWSYAFRLAGWPDNRPVWSASCPCQPFSAAGKGGAFADERHLWPSLHWLIGNSRPITIFGEQVASPDGLAWLDTVQTDLENTYYSSGAIDICAAGIGAPHIRQRLYWRSDSGHSQMRGSATAGETQSGRAFGTFTGLCLSCTHPHICKWNGCQISELPNAASGRFGMRGIASGLSGLNVFSGETRGFWRDCEWWYGRDEKYRPIEPGLFPLAHGVPGRVGKLRGYGNAIVPELAAEFIQASEGE